MKTSELRKNDDVGKLGSIELSERSRFMVQKVGSKPALDASFTPQLMKIYRASVYKFSKIKQVRGIELKKE